MNQEQITALHDMKDLGSNLTCMDGTAFCYMPNECTCPYNNGITASLTNDNFYDMPINSFKAGECKEFVNLIGDDEDLFDITEISVSIDVISTNVILFRVYPILEENIEDESGSLSFSIDDVHLRQIAINYIEICSKKMN